APSSDSVTQIDIATGLAAGHMVVQFNDVPSAELVRLLTDRGVRVLADVPDNALLISSNGTAAISDLGARMALTLTPQDKISPLITGSGDGFFVVEFHADVDDVIARSTILNTGLVLRDNPDLRAHHLLVYAADQSVLWTLAGADEVAYIFPAS